MRDSPRRFPFFVQQVREFHGLKKAIHDHGGSEAGAEAEEEHVAAVVAARACIEASLMIFTGKPKALEK